MRKQQQPPHCPDGQPHHWRIAPNRRRYSMGVCRRCGERRQFDNALPERADFNGRNNARRRA